MLCSFLQILLLWRSLCTYKINKGLSFLLLISFCINRAPKSSQRAHIRTKLVLIVFLSPHMESDYSIINLQPCYAETSLQMMSDLTWLYNSPAILSHKGTVSGSDFQLRVAMDQAEVGQQLSPCLCLVSSLSYSVCHPLLNVSSDSPSSVKITSLSPVFLLRI
jgi:hypothetical protein